MAIETKEGLVEVQRMKNPYCGIKSAVFAFELQFKSFRFKILAVDMNFQI